MFGKLFSGGSIFRKSGTPRRSSSLGLESDLRGVSIDLNKKDFKGRINPLFDADPEELGLSEEDLDALTESLAKGKLPPGMNESRFKSLLDRLE